MINKIKKKENIIIILIVFLGLFLRLYRLEEIFSFSGELGENLLEVKNYLIQGNIPSLGPQTSHPWLFFGPLYYWLLTPVLIIFRYNPVSISILGIISGIIGILINYIVLEKIINKRVALISSFLIAISPYYISFSRSGRFMFWESIFFYLYIYCLFKIDRKIYKYWFYLGIVLGIMLNFHFTPIALFPVVLIFLMKINLKDLKIKMLTKFSIGILIPMFPFLIYDVKNGFNITKNLILWIPYRFLGFFGFIPQNNYSLDVLKRTIFQIYYFFLSTIVYEKNILAIIMSIIIIIEIFKNIKYRIFIYRVINYSVLFMILALIIHSDPPSHYFVPILPIPIILISIFLTRMSERFKGNLIISIFCIVISITNLTFLFSKNYYFSYNSEDSGGSSNVTYQMQKDMAKCIIEDAKGNPYLLRRIGPNQEFIGDFAQNYQYLLWFYGNEPVIVGENIISKNIKPVSEYKIVENDNKYLQDENIICREGGIIILKTKLL